MPACGWEESTTAWAMAKSASRLPLTGITSASGSMAVNPYRRFAHEARLARSDCVTAGEWDTAAQLCDEAIEARRARSDWRCSSRFPCRSLPRSTPIGVRPRRRARRFLSYFNSWRRPGSDGRPSACGLHSRCSSFPSTMDPRAGARS